MDDTINLGLFSSRDRSITAVKLSPKQSFTESHESICDSSVSTSSSNFNVLNALKQKVWPKRPDDQFTELLSLPRKRRFGDSRFSVSSWSFADARTERSETTAKRLRLSDTIERMNTGSEQNSYTNGIIPTRSVEENQICVKRTGSVYGLRRKHKSPVGNKSTKKASESITSEESLCSASITLPSPNVSNGISSSDSREITPICSRLKFKRSTINWPPAFWIGKDAVKKQDQVNLSIIKSLFNSKSKDKQRLITGTGGLRSCLKKSKLPVTATSSTISINSPPSVLPFGEPSSVSLTAISTVQSSSAPFVFSPPTTTIPSLLPSLSNQPTLIIPQSNSTPTNLFSVSGPTNPKPLLSAHRRKRVK